MRHKVTGVVFSLIILAGLLGTGSAKQKYRDTKLKPAEIKEIVLRIFRENGCAFERNLEKNSNSEEASFLRIEIGDDIGFLADACNEDKTFGFVVREHKVPNRGWGRGVPVVEEPDLTEQEMINLEILKMKWEAHFLIVDQRDYTWNVGGWNGNQPQNLDRSPVTREMMETRLSNQVQAFVDFTKTRGVFVPDEEVREAALKEKSEQDQKTKNAGSSKRKR